MKTVLAVRCLTASANLYQRRRKSFLQRLRGYKDNLPGYPQARGKEAICPVL